MEYFTEALLWVFTVILGLGWGSYATMATYRFPRNEPWGGKKPRCPSCEHELKFKDFAPIWAYVINRGKCKFCGVKVTPVYLCTEIYCLLVFLSCFIAFGFSEQFLLATTIGVFVVIFTVTELESDIIPDKTLFLLLLIGIVYRTFIDHSIYGLFYGGLIGMMLGLAAKHVLAWRKGDAFDWKEAFLLIFTPEFVYVRLLILMGIILPIPLFLLAVVVAGMLNSILYFLWHRGFTNLPAPYGGVLGVLLLAGMLY